MGEPSPQARRNARQKARAKTMKAARRAHTEAARLARREAAAVTGDDEVSRWIRTQATYHDEERD